MFKIRVESDDDDDQACNKTLRKMCEEEEKHHPIRSAGVKSKCPRTRPNEEKSIYNPVLFE